MCTFSSYQPQNPEEWVGVVQYCIVSMLEGSVQGISDHVLYTRRSNVALYDYGITYFVYYEGDMITMGKTEDQ